MPLGYTEHDRARELTMPPQPSNDAGRYETIETCHSTWIFDVVEHRFARLPRGHLRASTPALLPSAQWQLYDAVVVDPVSGAFLVRLNPSGSQILRSKIHHDPCPFCGGAEPAPPTVELTAVHAPPEEPVLPRS